ncbi:MAG: hypothetical protein M1275_02265, partial [Patescibacteria group bacterium]|nr:hypothetical protein [Patescibacteria group bacterium]
MKTVPDFYTGKKILITGANAYLGPKLADMLAQIDCQLVLHGHKDFKPVFSQSVAKIETLSGD